jgi:hypothetical protein
LRNGCKIVIRIFPDAAIAARYVTDRSFATDLAARI